MALRTVEPIFEMDGTWVPVAVNPTVCTMTQVDPGRAGFEWFVGIAPPADPAPHGHLFKDGEASPPVDGVVTVFVKGPKQQYLIVTHDGA